MSLIFKKIKFYQK